MLSTFQHGQVHGIVGFLRDTEHHLQAVFDLPFTFFAASQQLLNRNTPRNHDKKKIGTETPAVRSCTARHLQQELILGDSLHRLNQVGGDGVGQSVPLLNFLHEDNNKNSAV